MPPDKAAAMRSHNGCMILPVFKIKKQSQLKEGSVTSRYFWCAVLIVALSVTLPPRVEAQSGGGKIVSNGTIVGVVVGVVAAVVIVAVVLVHKSSGKRTVTRMYRLSGRRDECD